MIEPYTDNTDSGSNNDFTRNFQETLNSKNPWDRIFALGKISLILQRFEENDLNVIDKKLIKGVYTRQQNEHGYLQKKNDIHDDENKDGAQSDSSENGQSYMTESFDRDTSRFTSHKGSLQGHSDLLLGRQMSN